MCMAWLGAAPTAALAGALATAFSFSVDRGTSCESCWDSAVFFLSFYHVVVGSGRPGSLASIDPTWATWPLAPIPVLSGVSLALFFEGKLSATIDDQREPPFWAIDQSVS